MVQVRSDGEEEEDPNDIVSSHSLTQMQHSPEPELPTLPFDVLPEILCRLPVKLLVQLRCLCKFFNSLISDPKFAKKHLQFSTKRPHLVVETYSINKDESVLHHSPIPSLFSTSSVLTQTQLYPLSTLTYGHNYLIPMCSCDGIFVCRLNAEDDSYCLWNPSIRKSKLLPPLENHKFGRNLIFGYDHFIDNYKVVAVSSKNEVSVITLGTDYWRRIEDIPYSDPIWDGGVFFSGTVNWFASDVIISLHLEKESYQKLCLPDSENDSWALHVMMDCLCGFATNGMFSEFWIMKEYGNQESWTKLYTVPNLQIRGFKAYDALYISKDGQLLLDSIDMLSYAMKLIVYNSKTDTLNIPEFQNNYKQIYQNVYIESLISP